MPIVYSPGCNARPAEWDSVIRHAKLLTCGRVPVVNVQTGVARVLELPRLERSRSALHPFWSWIYKP